MEADVVIVGGGAAGLWLLDELHRRGYGVLLAEAFALGSGQTIASQGIIHGGIKYSLGGRIGDSSLAIRDMPRIWRECLAGARRPDLTQTTVLSESCLLWRSTGLLSRAALAGTRVALRSQVCDLETDELPPVLHGISGDVLRVDEQVIAPATFVRDLANQHRKRLLKVADNGGVSFSDGPATDGYRIRFRSGPQEPELAVHAKCVVLTAGEGNAVLRDQLRLARSAMQQRPLHMALVCGPLPRLFGHCVDAAATRLTITTGGQLDGETVWQLGGQLAEDGVAMSADQLIARAKSELHAVLPALDLSDLRWATYRVNRAEAANPGGKRPDGPALLVEGNVLTAWPTKLALVPELVARIVQHVEHSGPRWGGVTVPSRWPVPAVANPPWEKVEQWRP